jgi:hypothetical protein
MTAFKAERRAIEAPPEIAGRFFHVRATPPAEDALAHELLVPKTFAPVSQLARGPAGPLEFTKISSFRGPDQDPAALDVGVARPGRDVSLADFLGSVVERYALEVISADPLDFGGREAVDALVRFLPVDQAMRTSRFLLFRHGSVLARVSATAPSDRYADHADDFAVALSTFRFVAPAHGEFLEPFRWSDSSGAIPLGLRHAEAWKLHERRDCPWGRQEIELRLADRSGAEGLIRIRAIDRDVARDLTLDKLVDDLEDDFPAAGFTGAVLRKRATPASPGAPFRAKAALRTFEGRAFGQPAEVRLMALESERALYGIVAIHAARAADPLAWMAGKRAAEVAFQTLNRPAEEILHPGAPKPSPAAPTSAPPSAAAAPASEGLREEE